MSAAVKPRFSSFHRARRGPIVASFLASAPVSRQRTRGPRACKLGPPQTRWSLLTGIPLLGFVPSLSETKQTTGARAQRTVSLADFRQIPGSTCQQSKTALLKQFNYSAARMPSLRRPDSCAIAVPELGCFRNGNNLLMAAPMPGRQRIISDSVCEPPTDFLADVAHRLARIETALATLIEQKTIKEWYSTYEVGSILAKAPFTVREWCRLGRIQAEKRMCGRGGSQEWMIAHEELVRLQNHGLRPDPNRYRHVR